MNQSSVISHPMAKNNTNKFIFFYCIFVLISCFPFRVKSQSNVSYIPFYTANTYDAKIIDVSKAVGAIAGTAGVSNGSASYSIPIIAPPRPQGGIPSPEITISYNSMAGDGVLGKGWNISGTTSVISRTQKTMAHNGSTEPSCTTSDEFVLDGQKIIKENVGSINPIETWQTEIENYSDIKSYRDANNRITHFIVVTKEGLTMKYGIIKKIFASNPTSYNIDCNSIGGGYLAFYLDEVTFPNGNTRTYSYTNGDWHDITIEYIWDSYGTTYFSYKKRIDYNEKFQNGKKYINDLLLDYIEVSATNNDLVRRYNFKYSTDNIHSFLSEVEEEAYNGEKLQPTIFKYGDRPQASIMTQSSAFTIPKYSTAYPYMEFVQGDFNRDGYSDIAVFDKSSYTGSEIYGMRVFINQKNNQYQLTYSDLFSSGSAYIANKDAYHNFMTSDFNGDGLDDIFIVNNTMGNTTILQNTITYFANANGTFTKTTTGIPASNYMTPCFEYRYSLLGDFDGDGKTDCFMKLHEKFVWVNRYFINNSPISTACDANHLDGQTISNAKVLDFDGDGKSEIMLIDDQNATIYSIVYVNNAYAFKIIYTTSLIKNNYSIFPGDFNGDRKTDFLVRNGSGYNDPWFILTSTGIEYWSNSFTFNVTPSGTQQFSTAYANPYIAISDYDGDGRSDILHATYNSTWDRKLDVYFSQGNSFHRLTFQPSFVYFPNVYSSLYGKDFIVGDFNGDGKSDIFTNYIDGNSGQYVESYTTSFFKNGKELLLEKIKNGLGKEDIFTYQMMTDNTNNLYTGEYNNSASYTTDIPYVKLPIPLVSNYVSTCIFSGNQFANMSFKYLGGAMDRKGRSFLGYREIQTIDNIHGTTNYTYLNPFSSIDFILLNTLSKTLRTSDNLLLENVIYNYDINSTYSANGNRYRIKLETTYSTSYLNGSKNTTTSYDNYGNLTSKIENQYGKTIQTTINYGTNASNRPALPLSTSVSYSSMTPTTSYLTQFEYNTLYQLTKKTEFANLSKPITTEYIYNSIGNIIEEKVTGSGMAPRKVTTEYDATWGLYISKLKNALNQETNYNVDPRLNQPLSVTGIDGLTTYYQYDAWGRKIKTIYPNTKEVNESISWNIASNYGIPSLYQINISNNQNNTINTTIYDEINRPVIEKKQLSDGNFIVVVSNYNYQAQLASLYKFNNSTPIDRLFYNYDFFGRKIYTIKYNYLTNNFTTLEQTTYNKSNDDWLVNTSIPPSATNPTGSTSYQKYRGKELLESSENGINLLTYEYNSESKPTKVLMGSTVISESQYDAYGRQSVLIDNSAGMHGYEYNGLGELYNQTNPNNGFVRFEYDILGRKTSEVINEGKIVYTYFPSGSGVKTNKLQKVTGYQNANKEEYDYDVLGRMNLIKKYVRGSGVAPYTTSFVYNTNDDIIQTTKPSGHVYNYIYNGFGALTSISKGSNVLYTLNSIGIFGKPTSYSLGSGNLVSMTYDNDGSIQTIQSNHLDEEYQWDPINLNLISKNENNQGFNYTYQYDNFGRLTQESLSKNGQQIDNSLIYDTKGNILSKNSAGDYNYHSGKQFAVKTILNASYVHPFSPYKQDITYNSFNKPTQLTQNTDRLNYSYDHNYNRIQASLTKNNIVQYRRYYAGTSEYNYNSNGTPQNSIDYIYAGDRLVAMDVVDSRLGTSTLWHVEQDYQNTIRAVYDDKGTSYTQNFDAWGNYRDPNTGQIASTSPSTLPDWLYRGYTEHEYLPEFGLINMNARLYDPHISRTLSPDNYVQSSTLDGFNRFSYCHNNPLKYSDPDGNNPIVIGLGILIGAYIGGLSSNHFNFNPCKWQWDNNTWINVAAGGLAGGVGGGMGGVLPFGGFEGGAISGAAAGFANSATIGIYNLANHTNGYNWSNLFGDIGVGTLSGAIVGGLVGGTIDAAIQGRNFWNGKYAQYAIEPNLTASNSSNPINGEPPSESSVWNYSDKNVYFKSEEYPARSYDYIRPNSYLKPGVKVDGIATKFRADQVFKMPNYTKVNVLGDGQVFFRSDIMTTNVIKFANFTGRPYGWLNYSQLDAGWKSLFNLAYQIY